MITSGVSVVLGCDPEFFFASTEDGRILGSERVLDKNLERILANEVHTPSHWATHAGAFVVDGVQVELNPRPYTCRAYLGNEIASSMKALKAHLATMGSIKADFTSVVEVSHAELQALSDKARTFGCAPSLNSHAHTPSVKIDASKYKKRAAGGHIHIGLDSYTRLMDSREALVPLLDVMIGNTCVLIDRDPLQVERRKHYGRAGEYRLPKHGLEYRTLSNFWLRSYPLMGLVMGLVKQTVRTFDHGLPGSLSTINGSSRRPMDELLAKIDLDLVERAINLNDATLAWPTYLAVREFFTQEYNDVAAGLGGRNGMARFDYFLSRVWRDGIESWFPDDPLEHWAALPEGHGCGWEAFLHGRVANEHESAVKKGWAMVAPSQ